MKKLLLASALASTLGSVAGAAVTTSGDDGVRWSGTTPDMGPPDMCQFTEIKDGKMDYFEGEHNYTISHDGTTGYGSVYSNKPMIGGRWITSESAEIRVKHRGASHLVVEALNVVYNSSDGTEYPAQVDYNPYTYSMRPSDYSQNPDYPYIASFSDAVRVNEGYQVSHNGFSITTLIGGDSPTYENQAGQTWLPNVSNVDTHKLEAEDKATFEINQEWEPYLPDELFNHRIAIGGVAWMVDANGESKYDPNNYGMTKGNYFAPHRVSCIQ